MNTEPKAGLPQPAPEQTINPPPIRVMRGRPPKHYTTPVMMAVIERVANGETLTSICREEGMPAPGTFREWVVNNQELRAAWEAAKELRAHALFDRVLDIVDTLTKQPQGWGKDSAAHVRALTEAMNSLKWAASKLAPQQYGERPPLLAVVPIHITTSLDIGQGGKAHQSDGGTPGVYHVKAALPIIDATATPLADGKPVTGGTSSTEKGAAPQD